MVWKIPRSISWAWIFLASAMLVFTILRATIYAQNAAYFQEMGGHTGFAFLLGLRFDLSIILAVLGIPLCLLQLPLKYRWYFRLWSLLAVVLFALLLLLEAFDVGYFQETQQHITDQIFSAWGDAAYLGQTALGSYGHYLLLWLLLAGGLGWFTWSWSKRPATPWPLKIALPYLGCFFIFLYWGVMGHVGLLIRKRIAITDAYYFPQYPAVAQLSLNGSFTATYYLARYRKMLYGENYRPPYPAATATANVAQALRGPGRAATAAFPLRAHNEGNYHPPYRTSPPAAPNILLIMVESLDAELSEAWRELHPELSFPQIPAGLTPHLDQIARQGLRFTRFYPNATKSSLALQSALLMIPPLPGISPVPNGIELKNVFRVGINFSQHHYHTFFAQGAYRTSFHLDAFARSVGIENVFGREDYPALSKQRPSVNGFDGELLQFVAQHVAAQQDPFLGVVFTGTTHTPYVLPETFTPRFPHDDNLNGFYNTIMYFDQALGDFMAQAEAQAWFKNTIFIITADHRKRRFVGHAAAIPLIIYAPHWLQPQVYEVVGSQVDLIPTIFALLGWPDEYAGIGRNLFAPLPHWVMAADAQELTYLDEQAQELTLAAQKVLRSDFAAAQTAQYKELILSIQQVLLQGQKENNIFPPYRQKAP